MGNVTNVQALRIFSTFVYTNHLPIKQLLRQEAYVELHLVANFEIDKMMVNPEWGHL